MLFPQRVRRVVWRLNGVLLVLVAYALVQAAAYDEPRAEPRVDVESLVPPAEPVELEAVSAHDFEAFLPVLRRFHPEPPEQPKAAAPVATRPPLRAFRVLLAVIHETDSSVLAIGCKDPAHPDECYLRPGEPDGEAEITAVSLHDKLAVFTVERGEESCVFRVPLGRGGGASTSGIIRIRPSTTTAPSVRGLTPPGERPERTVKVVPFRTKERDGSGPRDGREARERARGPRARSRGRDSRGRFGGVGRCRGVLGSDRRRPPAPIDHGLARRRVEGERRPTWGRVAPLYHSGGSWGRSPRVFARRAAGP